MRRPRTFFLLIGLVLSGCASDFDRRTAQLERELNIQGEPLFPKCTVREIDPKVGAIHSRVGTGISQTVFDPIGDVPLDECLVYEHEELESDP